MKKIDFYFDFASPNAYFGFNVLKKFPEKYDCEINYIPVLLGGIFKATNNKPPMEQFFGVLNKNEYQSLEIERFVNRHGLKKFKMNPHFPVISLQIVRGAIAAEMDGYLEDYIEKVLVHMWEEPKKMDDPEVIKAAFEESGFDSEKLLEKMQDPDVKAKLISNTEEAVKKGLFGIPTFFIDDEMYFGKDTIWMIEEILAES
jgi:2-hydroxychromene-2-carboxylate isomerase